MAIKPKALGIPFSHVLTFFLEKQEKKNFRAKRCAVIIMHKTGVSMDSRPMSA